MFICQTKKEVDDRVRNVDDTHGENVDERVKSDKTVQFTKTVYICP